MGRFVWRWVWALVAVVPAVGVTALSTARVASASSVAGNPPTSSLSDSFSGSALDTSKWQAGTNTTLPAPPVTVDGQLNISTSTGNGYSFITSNNLYSLRGSSVTTQLVSAGDQTIASAQIFPMEVVTLAGLYSSPGTDQGWQIMINQGSFAALQRRDILLGTWHHYDPAVDRYFRISESGGTIHFATSPDGVTWNEFFSYANPGVDIDNMVIRLTAGNWNTEARTTTAVFGNVNITPVPGPPTAVSATAAANQASVSWSPPANNGGATVTSYTVSATDSTTPANGGQTCSYKVASPETDTCKVSGLTNGDAYTFTVTATNANGTGPASVPSNAVTPAGVPDAPTGVTATPAAGSATVKWNPAGNEGSTILSYRATASPGGASCTYTVSQPENDTCTVSGLTNGTAYTFTVTATNANGTGPASSASLPVTVSGSTNSADVLIPSNAATLSGTVVLDGASTNPSAVKTFQYELTGGSYTNHVVATAKPTFYGWLAEEVNGTVGWDSTSVPSGTYTLTAVATYSDGTVVTSPGVSVTVNNPAPTAQVLIPSSGATLSGTTYLDGTASYTPNITHFSYDLDGAPIGNATGTLYGWLLINWNTATVANGSHTLTAVATYSDGATATSPGVTINIANP